MRSLRKLLFIGNDPDTRTDGGKIRITPTIKIKSHPTYSIFIKLYALCNYTIRTRGALIECKDTSAMQLCFCSKTEVGGAVCRFRHTVI